MTDKTHVSEMEPADANTVDADPEQPTTEEKAAATAEPQEDPPREAAASAPTEGEPPAEEPAQNAEAALAEAQDKYLRLQAEFENYKRRMHKEQGEILKYAQLPLLRDLTGAMDNLERAIDHARDAENPDHDAFVQGLEMVTKQIGQVFEQYGMQRIEAKGQPFDPTRHEAMNLVETDAVPENTVVEEFQVGYMLHERIVRPSMVSVSKPPAGNTAGEPDQPPNSGAPEDGSAPTAGE